MNERSVIYTKISFKTVTLTDRIGHSLVDRRIQYMLVIVFRVLTNTRQIISKDGLVQVRDNTKPLRKRNKLQVLEPNITGFASNQ